MPSMNTTVRILIVAALALLVHGGAAYLRAGLKPAKVALPDRDYHQLPLQIGEWVGGEVDLQAEDPELWDKIGAHDVVERKYRNPAGQEILLHCAIFTEYDVGAFHLPTNCFRSQGFELVQNERFDVRDSDDSSGVQGSGDPQSVSLSVWRREDRAPAIACYWYELDQYTILSRFDIGMVRLKLGGQEAWPPLIKVLITTSSLESEQAKEQVRSFARTVHAWMHQPLDPSQANGVVK
ncbi:MAG: exosortase-associated EpsI family protein [Pirellulales bacterium]|nr:exosortase-associated EpsI family protein [Pirellulales bacterium]